jgi:hypothetical protein
MLAHALRDSALTVRGRFGLAQAHYLHPHGSIGLKAVWDPP